jgi:tyrosyl-tRNA synthetase
VELQMGGADQWGNMTAGLELIRKEFGTGEAEDLAHAVSYPLLTNDSGAKFGKTAAGTSVWLDPARTSPFHFYQYWLDADDRDVRQVPAHVHAVRPGEDRGSSRPSKPHIPRAAWRRRRSAST